MASEPIPEPLANQGVDEEREPELREARPGLADNAEALNAVVGCPNPSRELEPGKMNPHLNRAAGVVGSTVGRVVTRARNISDRGEQTVTGLKENTKSKLGQMKRNATDAVEAAQQSASIGFQQAKERVSESVETARFNATNKLQQARLRARQVMHEYPLHVIAASAALGLLTGILLRLRRSNRYE